MATYEGLKDDMTICDGERVGGYAYPCNGHLYRCKACGNVGCRQMKDHACTKQGFSVTFTCYACGVMNQYEAIESGHEKSKSAASTPERIHNHN